MPHLSMWENSEVIAGGAKYKKQLSVCSPDRFEAVVGVCSSDTE